MLDERPIYNNSYMRRANMRALRVCADMAMEHDVMLSVDGLMLKSLSMASWQKRQRVDAFELRFAVLGVFRADAGETRADVYRRLYDEAAALRLPLGEPEM